MSFTVAAFYRFASLPDCAEIRAGLAGVCTAQDIRGTILLAPEGINGTVAGSADAIAALVAHFRDGEAFAGRLAGIDVKLSSAAEMPFRRMKVKLKREIVTLGVEGLDPSARTGTYVEPADWNALIAADDVLVIDTRNRFEVAMGTFAGAVDPETRKFSQFPDYVRRTLDPARHKRVAMFCTGGIRCEKASAYLLAHGFPEVYHLKGGILNYLEKIPEGDSRWEGACFVFDERVALGHGLAVKDADGEGDAGDSDISSSS